MRNVDNFDISGCTNERFFSSGGEDPAPKDFNMVPCSSVLINNPDRDPNYSSMFILLISRGGNVSSVIVSIDGNLSNMFILDW